MTSRSLRLAVLVATLLTTTTYSGLAADADSTATTAVTTTTTATAADTVQTKELTAADKEKAQLVESMNEKAAKAAAAEEAKGFKDVKNHWAAVPINVMLEDGILSGNGQGEFKPDDALKTADAAALYDKLIAHDKAQQAAKDAKSSQNKKNAKITVVKDVTGEELLAPFKNQKTLTREEFAQTVAEYLAYKDELTVASIKSKTKAKEYKPNVVVAPDQVSFPDESKIDREYKSSVTTLASRGIIASGGDSNFFRPTEDITRAEAVAMLFRIEKGMMVSPATDSKNTDTKSSTATSDSSAALPDSKDQNTTTGNVTAKQTSDLEAQSDLENKVFKKLNTLYKTPGNFQNYGVMYWQNDVLHVAFKSDDDLAKFEDILAKGAKNKAADEALNNRIHLETTQYRQAEYDRIENNFRTFYAQKQPAGTILGAYPSVAHNQLIVRIDKGFDYMNDSIRNAFGNKVHVFLVTTDNANATTDTSKN